MLTKTDATEFLNSLAETTGSDTHPTRVIVVRSGPTLKRFVADSLEVMEELSPEDGPPRAEPAEAAERLAIIANTARSAGCPVLAQALELVELWLLVVESGSETSAGLAPVLRTLSTALLRVYVEGHDTRCHTELSALRAQLSRFAPHVVIRPGDRSTAN